MIEFAKSIHVAAGYAHEWAWISLWMVIVVLVTLKSSPPQTKEGRYLLMGIALLALAELSHRGFWVAAIWTSDVSGRAAGWAYEWQWLHVISAQVYLTGACLIQYGILLKTFGPKLWWQLPASLAVLAFFVGTAISVW